ncbi:MAG: ribosome silencing factor [Tatlockia sp.]|jgi:ribosome-associated protein
MSEQSLYLKELQHALEENQAIDVVVIDVRAQTSVTDYMIVCSGRSSRQVKAIAQLVMEHMKKIGLPSLGQHGLDSGDWALIDFGDFVLHVMQPEARAFYNIEGLWQSAPEQ